MWNKGKKLALPRVLPFAGHWATKGKKEKKENVFLRISCLIAKVTCRSEQNAVIVAVIANEDRRECAGLRFPVSGHWVKVP